MGSPLDGDVFCRSNARRARLPLGPAAPDALQEEVLRLNVGRVSAPLKFANFAGRVRAPPEEREGRLVPPAGAGARGRRLLSHCRRPGARADGRARGPSRSTCSIGTPSTGRTHFEKGTGGSDRTDSSKDASSSLLAGVPSALTIVPIC